MRRSGRSVAHIKQRSTRGALPRKLLGTPAAAAACELPLPRAAAAACLMLGYPVGMPGGVCSC
jgi:hypothetical protein